MSDMRTWARLGASARLKELTEERDAILKMFPDLRADAGGARRRRGRPSNVEATAATADRDAASGTPKKRTMSAEARRKISLAQKRRWRKQNAAKQ
jgi:hypothetical protein